jgi:hypothetical protein
MTKKAEVRPSTSPAAVAQRRSAITAAYRINRQEGIESSPEGRKIHSLWVKGEVTGDEARAMIIRAHTGITQA